MEVAKPLSPDRKCPRQISLRLPGIVTAKGGFGEQTEAVCDLSIFGTLDRRKRFVEFFGGLLILTEFEQSFGQAYLQLELRVEVGALLAGGFEGAFVGVLRGLAIVLIDVAACLVAKFLPTLVVLREC